MVPGFPTVTTAASFKVAPAFSMALWSSFCSSRKPPEAFAVWEMHPRLPNGAWGWPPGLQPEPCLWGAITQAAVMSAAKPTQGEEKLPAGVWTGSALQGLLAVCRVAHLE